MFGIAAILAVVVVLIAIFKYQNFQGNIANFLMVALLVTLIASAGYIYIRYGADFSTFEGVLSFVKLYFAWMGNMLGNTGDIAGYVINQDWTAIENITASA